MIHSSVSPITQFVLDLADESALKSAGVKLLLGRAELARTTAARRIVWVPVGGPYAAPDTERERHSAAPVLAVVRQTMVGRIWGESIDDVWDIHQRLLQALNSYVAAGGVRFDHEAIQWETEADTSEQGEALEVKIVLRLPVTRAAESTQTIAEVSAQTKIVNAATEVEEDGPLVEAP